jgi:hypothetical protein
MLVKQWPSAYISGLSAMYSIRARQRQHCYDCLVTWKTGHIVNSLPLAMSFPFILFLGGLSVMLYSISTPVALVSIIIAATVLLHLSNLILLAICDCPWKPAIFPVIFWLLAPPRRLQSAQSLRAWLKLVWRKRGRGVLAVVVERCLAIALFTAGIDIGVTFMSECMPVQFRGFLKEILRVTTNGICYSTLWKL